MKTRRAVTMAVDAAMYLLMLFLLSYPLTRGLLWHGACGAAFLGLMLLHQALNLSWYRTLFRGKWNAARALLTAADAALLASGTALLISSLAMAGEVFAFAPFPMTSWGRGLHMAATTWTFTLASFHLGMHGRRFWEGVNRSLGRAWPVAAAVLLALGIGLFVNSGMWQDMLMTGMPKTSLRTLPLFLWHYLGATLSFCLLARAALCLAGKKASPKKRRGSPSRKQRYERKQLSKGIPDSPADHKQNAEQPFYLHSVAFLEEAP